MKRFNAAVLVWLAVGAIPIQAQSVVDLGGVSNDGGGVVNFGISDGSNNEKVAQRFTGLNATISKVSVALSKTGNPTDNIVVEIRQDSQNGLFLASGSISGLSIGTTRGPRYEITVAPTFMVSSIRNYYAVFSRSGSSDGRNFFFAVRGTSGSIYGGVTSSEYSYLKTGLGWAGSNLANSFILSLIGTPAPPPPAIPSGLTAVVAGNQVSLVWNLGGELALAYYKIYRNQTNGFVPTSVDSIGRVNKPVATFTDTGLALGTYYYRVTAVDSFNSVSAPSLQATAIVVSAIAPPVMSVSVSSLLMDSTLVGSSSQKTLTISNTGGANLSVTVIAIGGTDASQFVVVLSSAVIAPGGTQNVTVTFSPASTGAKMASLTLIHNAAGSPTTVALSGVGKSTTPAPPPPSPAISVTPASLTMDSTLVGSFSQKTLVVSNTGSSNLVVSNIVRSSADSAQFAVSPASFTVSPSGSQTVTVNFVPATATQKSTILNIVHNAAGSPTQVVVSGVGKSTTPPPVSSPAISVPTSLIIDTTIVGSTSQKTFVLANTGTANLVVLGIALIGTDAAMFSVLPTTATIASGSSQTIAVSFAPVTVGAKSTILTISHNANGGSTVVSVSGFGKTIPAQPTPGISAPASLTMDSTLVGSFSQKTLVVSNTGSSNLVVSNIVRSSADSAQFAVSPTAFTVSPSGSQVLVVTFSPVSVGNKIAVLTIGHNASGGTTTVSVSGVGRVPPSQLPPAQPPPSQPPPNQPPLAVPDSALKVDFTLSTQKGLAPLNVKFMVNFTPYLGVPTRRFVFYTGAGDSLVNNPYDNIVYQKPGIYTPSVVVYFEDGRVRSAVKPNYITVLEPSPSIDFTASPLSGVAPLSVIFKARNIGGPATGYAWNLGDTTIAAPVDSLVHRYQKGGTYTIILTATGPGGTDTKTKNGYIVLSEPPPPPPPPPLSPSADFDGSGQIGLDDYFLFAAAFGQPVTAANRKFDLNQDGVIDLTDFFFFAEKFGK